MDRYFDIKNRLLDIAENDEKLCTVIVFGSHARNYSEADEYSDIDFMIVCNNPDEWLFGSLPGELGEIKISFVEPTFAGTLERRILYSNSSDVDLIVLTPDQFYTGINNGTINEVMRRGYTVLYDRIGIKKIIDDNIIMNICDSVMTKQEFINTVNDFWFHTVWSSKKLLRGELWSAIMCIDAYLKNRLLKIIEMNKSLSDKVDVWHNGRFLEKWADNNTIKALGNCFSHYEKEDMISALFNTAELFGTLARSIAQKCSYEYPLKEEEYALSLLKNFFA